MRKDRIDVIIPAFKAHSTIIRCLSSIACQTIIDDVSVVVCNDCCPEGDYSDAVKMFSTVMDIREIKLPKNSGPGAARQYGIDNTDGEFFTCIDADDERNSDRQHVQVCIWRFQGTGNPHEKPGTDLQESCLDVWQVVPAGVYRKIQYPV